MRVKFNDANCKLYTNLLFIEVNVISPDQTTNEKSLVSKVHQNCTYVQKYPKQFRFLLKGFQQGRSGSLKENKNGKQTNLSSANTAVFP